MFTIVIIYSIFFIKNLETFTINTTMYVLLERKSYLSWMAKLFIIKNLKIEIKIFYKHHKI